MITSKTASLILGILSAFFVAGLIDISPPSKTPISNPGIAFLGGILWGIFVIATLNLVEHKETKKCQ